VFRTNVVEKIETNILWSITFSKNRVVTEVMWKNVVETVGIQMTI